MKILNYLYKNLLNYLYRNSFRFYILYVIFIVILVHSAQWLFFYLFNGPIPTLTFMISYAIATMALVFYMFGKKGPDGLKNKLYKKIESLEQKEKLRHLINS